MSKTILKLEPIFQEKIWGGSRLNRVFGYEIPSEATGECWAISGHAAGNCKVSHPEYEGMTIGELWNTHREFFGNLAGDTFPLLIKIIDAKDDLSIQVHPDDVYAAEHEKGSLGKTECWYVLDCDENATIIIGHHAKTKAEMARMVEEDRWKELLREVPIHKGDFFQIEPGCLHAIKGGTMILETQQSSDVTYRFYDYGRLENGKPRQLHISQSLDVTTVPFVEQSAAPEVSKQEDATVTHLVTCPYYSVYRVELDGQMQMNWTQPFVNLSIIDGEGTIDGQSVQKGDHFLICDDYGEMKLEGRMEYIYSHI
jgi:mannose-6-phosphate isomerase/beta-glucosidase